MIIGASFAFLASAAAARMSVTSHLEIQTQPQTDPDLARLPTVHLDTIVSSVPVDDRLNADAAFDKPFTESLREGLTWYLARRGLRITESGEDVRVAGTIDRYEGFKGWGHWGVDVVLVLRLYEGEKPLGPITLHSLMKYSDDEEVEDEVKPKYKERGRSISFPEILFTRVTADLAEKLIVELKERGAGPALAARAATDQGTGLVSIDASVPNAEVAVDGHLVGTTPLQSIPLPAGDHVIEVTKKGFKAWRRDIRVLRGESSRLVAELEADER
jgi:hypothetical protein